MRMRTRRHQTMVTEISKMINFWGRFVYSTARFKLDSCSRAMYHCSTAFQ